MRYEIKFTLPINSYNEFNYWLKFKSFFYRKFPDRYISTLYFDTKDYLCAQNNIDGVSSREKYRIRSYDSIFNNNKLSKTKCNFEIKSKQNRLCKKIIFKNLIFELKLKKKNFYIFDKNKFYDSFKKKDWPKSAVPIEHLEPILFVFYNREYFSCNDGIRLTVDHNINFKDFNDINKKTSFYNSYYTRKIVELKFSPKKKDQVAEILSSLPFYPTRNSKYLLGLSLLNKAIYI